MTENSILHNKYNYNCPKCGWDPAEHHDYIPDGYKAKNGKIYPVYKNGWESNSPYGWVQGWTEVHFCPNCKIEFSFDNGT